VILTISLKLYLTTCDLLHDGDYTSLRERLRTMDARQVLAHQWARSNMQIRTSRGTGKSLCESTGAW
jgi:hypothetical protein